MLNGAHRLGLYATAGFKAVYGYEDLWAKVMFEEWGADEANIDHMCNTPACEDAPGEGHLISARCAAAQPQGTQLTPFALASCTLQARSTSRGSTSSSIRSYRTTSARLWSAGPPPSPRWYV